MVDDRCAFCHFPRMPDLTPQQTARRKEFVVSLNAAIIKVADPIIGQTDQHMSENCIRDWNADDWPDLKDDTKERITTGIARIRANIEAFVNQTGERRADNAETTFQMYKDLINLLSRNGVQVLPPQSKPK